MTSAVVVSIIVALAPIFGIDPKVAVAVATVESQLNPNAKGSSGEIGLFQIMPNIAKKKGFTPKQLYTPVLNVYFGLQMLQDAKRTCVHQNGNDWLVCYNYGQKNAKTVHYPHKFPYVKKVNAEIRRLNGTAYKQSIR